MSSNDNPYQTGSYQSGNGYSGQSNTTISFGDTPKPSAAVSLDGNFGGEQADAASLIKDTTTADFPADVIQESRNQPVLVDFWAPWCGPCRQLGPIIEKAVAAAGGRVKLVKLNIDDHPAIPGQMGIQSIPAVVAFSNGQPVDGFMGALPESQVAAFIDKIAAAGPDKADDGVAEVLAQGQQALEAGDHQTAAQAFSAIIQHQPDNLKAYAGLAECMIATGHDDDAVKLLDQLSDEQKKDPGVASILTRMAQAEEVAKLGDPVALEARLQADANDHAARMDLAKILNVQGKRNEAADHLLTIMRKDREFEDDGARKTLLSFFEAWGPTDPATLSARRKLSSILFS